VRFLVDACAGRTLARWLRDSGHDVAESVDHGPDPGDEAILARAFRESRVLVTMDKDFGSLVYLLGQPHAGLIRLPHVPRAQRIALFQQILERHRPDEIEGAVVTVRGSRILISRSFRRKDEQ
jgi:predicted nuclease of predicted toxin-antitoxin system